MNERSASAGRGASLPVGGVDFGDLGRTEPIGRTFGGDRGTPIDRHYIEAFLARHADDIGGAVLEIGDRVYTERFGAGRVRRSDVLDAPDAGNADATILADLAQGGGVPSDRFDCIILTQTLHMIYDLHGALKTVHRALRPGGVLLATVPGISQIDAGIGRGSWFWSMTPLCAGRFFGETFAPEDVTVTSSGNVLAAMAFLQGLAVQDVRAADLDVVDPLYPVITAIRAVKASACADPAPARPA